MNLKFWFILLCLLLCGCCKKLPTFKAPCCISGRRPQVMVEKTKAPRHEIAPCTWLPLDPREECPMEERPLTEEDLKPYVVPPGECIVQVGDIFDLSLTEEEDFKFEDILVAPDGKLYFSTIGGIPAAGKTMKELIHDIEKALSILYLDPHVTLSPKYLGAYKWVILGRVREPGVYPLMTPMTLRGAFGVAGGLLIEEISSNTQLTSYDTRTWADLHRSFVIRDGKKLQINFEKLLYSKDDQQNIYLRPNDYIFIAPLERKEVFILGDVLTPRKMTYVRDLTLMGALAQGGGWTTGTPFSPDLTQVLIMRGSLKNPSCYVVNIQQLLKGEVRDVKLCPGDIIFVPSKPFRFVRLLVRAAIDAFVYGFMNNAGQFWSQYRWFPSPLPSSDSDTGDDVQ